MPRYIAWFNWQFACNLPVFQTVGEVNRQSDTIKKLEDAIAQAHVDHEMAKRRQEDDFSDRLGRRDETIKQLQDDLAASQGQYSTTYG